MRYCSLCAHELETRVPEHDNMPRSVCPNCQHVHYVNPKIIAGVIPYYKNEIMLCKRAIEPAFGKWTVPGGFLECNETVIDGAKREAQEEAGIQFDTCSLFSVYSITHVNQVYMVFAAELPDKTYSCGPETERVIFVEHNNIPWDDIAFSAIKWSLEKFVDSFPKHAALPAFVH